MWNCPLIIIVILKNDFRAKRSLLDISYGSLGVLRTQEKIGVMNLQVFGFVRNYNFMTTKIILNINETVWSPTESNHAEFWSPSSSWDLRVGLGGSQGSKGRAGHLVELKETVIFKTHSRRGPSLILEFTFSFHLEYAWKTFSTQKRA